MGIAGVRLGHVCRSHLDAAGVGARCRGGLQAHAGVAEPQDAAARWDEAQSTAAHRLAVRPRVFAGARYFNLHVGAVRAPGHSTLLAAHQVTLDVDAFVYMVPTGLSYAAMIRVGQAAGRNDLRGVQRSTNATVLLALGYGVAAAACVPAVRTPDGRAVHQRCSRGCRSRAAVLVVQRSHPG